MKTATLERTFEIARRLLELEQRSDRSPPTSPESLREEIGLSLPREGLGEAIAFDKLAEAVLRSPSTSNRRFFNQLFAGREPLATSAEMLSALLNNSMYTFKAAGVHILIELELVRKMGEMVGFDDADGTFVPGGSMANYVALLIAAGEDDEHFRERGLSGPRRRIYTSADCHYSIRKGAGMAGLGRGNVQTIPVDSEGRMIPEELRLAILADRAEGHRPLCIVGTAGTTVAGAFDPLDALAEIALEEGLWFHVDAAFGGTLLMHPERRRQLEGAERADSFAWDAHKMMGAPLSCAALLLPRKGTLQRHFDEAADYLYQQDDENLNLGTKSIQCGRRNDALKRWAAWQQLGDDGWAQRVERQLELARYARDWVVREPRLELVIEPQSVNVCFAVEGVRSDELCQRLSASGAAQVGHGLVGGRQIVRLVTSNPALDESDLDVFFEELLAQADAMAPSSLRT
ncbi:MAG: pyridoxal-dependent decarboxylase [Acidobacteriota bacterium]